MNKQPLVLFFVIGFCSLFAQSPHGDDFKIDCAQCHISPGWVVNPSNIPFRHTNEKTGFELHGQHLLVDCKLCHSSLVFQEADNDCISCHDDVHSMSLGSDCQRCHSSNFWMVDKFPELHEESGFPLTGAHGSLSCVECHFAIDKRRFDRIGNECISCHKNDYANTHNPNHQGAGFSQECISCHDPLGYDWFSANFDHDAQNFNIYSGVHKNEWNACTDCHQNQNNFADVNCLNCHAHNPNRAEEIHSNVDGFVYLSKACIQCHPKP